MQMIHRLKTLVSQVADSTSSWNLLFLSRALKVSVYKIQLGLKTYASIIMDTMDTQNTKSPKITCHRTHDGNNA